VGEHGACQRPHKVAPPAPRSSLPPSPFPPSFLPPPSYIRRAEGAAHPGALYRPRGGGGGDGGGTRPSPAVDRFRAEPGGRAGESPASHHTVVAFASSHAAASGWMRKHRERFAVLSECIKCVCIVPVNDSANSFYSLLLSESLRQSSLKSSSAVASPHIALRGGGMGGSSLATVVAPRNTIFESTEYDRKSVRLLR
jgi:hypothetical protein